MAIVETNWQRFLSSESGLPPDVFFVVKEDVEQGEVEEKEGSGWKTIEAHKFLLAGISPVFMAQFFGPMKETKDVFKVKDTTPQAFETMINYIYKPADGSFTLDNVGCAQKLFEILELSERYDIQNLNTLTTETLGNLNISRENLIFTATVAKNYKTFFEDLSMTLLLKCLKFLYDSTGSEVCALIKDTKENFPEASLDILNELIEVGSATFKVQGWGHLVYFDTDEHKISDERVTLANIPNVGAEWKITHEFKPTKYLQPTDDHDAVSSARRNRGPISFLVHLFGPGKKTLYICFPPASMALKVQFKAFDTAHVATETRELPIVGEWTKIEIAQEKEEDGRLFLSLSVAGNLVGRELVEAPTQDLAKVRISCGSNSYEQPGLIRRLVVLRKG